MGRSPRFESRSKRLTNSRLTYGEEVALIREDQAGVRAAQESVSLEYRELRSKLEAVDEGVDKANANVARVEKAKLDLTKAEELGARTERQLNALQALSDHINQKTGSVERQREALDRTEAQARSQIKDLKKVVIMHLTQSRVGVTIHVWTS